MSGNKANPKAASLDKGRGSLARDALTTVAFSAARRRAGSVRSHRVHKCRPDDIECSATCIFVKELLDL